IDVWSPPRSSLARLRSSADAYGRSWYLSSSATRFRTVGLSGCRGVLETRVKSHPSLAQSDLAVSLPQFESIRSECLLVSSSPHSCATKYSHFPRFDASGRQERSDSELEGNAGR